MTSTRKEISFDNTEHAFAYKTDAALKKARFLFKTMGYSWLVQLGTRLTPWAIRSGLPIRGLIRDTIFEQFVGGETLADTAVVADKLEAFHVQVILDYGVEGKSHESDFDEATEAFIRVIEFAATQLNIPFVSIKVTGLARFGLLEKLDAASDALAGIRGELPLDKLTTAEQEEWERVKVRMERIVAIAAANNIGVLVDAEESWIQDPVDALTMQMMTKYNKTRAVVFNTIQLYRHDRLAFLKDCTGEASKRNVILGVKLVRGAYMEKERKRAEQLGYPSPIQPGKGTADRDYDLAVKFCIEQLSQVSVIVATHNEQSNLLAVRLLEESGYPLTFPNIHFSQLYGMSDNITFNLAKAGCSVSKYLPFGPIGDVIPYLMRRAQENSSVKGQTGRELALINKEIKRRGI